MKTIEVDIGKLYVVEAKKMKYRISKNRTNVDIIPILHIFPFRDLVTGGARGATVDFFANKSGQILKIFENFSSSNFEISDIENQSASVRRTKIEKKLKKTVLPKNTVVSKLRLRIKSLNKHAKITQLLP